MAQLRDTLIQGSARVTDTLYANALKTIKFEADLIVPKSLTYASDILGGINYNYNTTVQGHIGFAASSTATSALLGLYCTGDIVLRPRGTIDNNNTFSSTTGIKITSTDLQPTGTMSLGTASTRWNKFYVQNSWYSYSGATQYPFDLVLYNQTPVIVGETWYDCGNATNVTTGKWNWRQYSPAATATATTSGKFETYSLPVVANGLTENKVYTIITTKNLSSITSVGTITSGTWNGSAVPVANGGTGATTAANARTNLGLGSVATYNISNGSYHSTNTLIPTIRGGDGVMEIGKYIDFHVDAASTKDYDARITASATGLTLSGTTTGTFSGSLSGNATNVTGTVAVAHGGTGTDTFTADCVIVGNGTNAMESRGLKVTGAVDSAVTISPSTTDKTFKISSTSTLYLNSKQGASIVFQQNDAEVARFNINGNLALGVKSEASAIGTQNTHKLYVGGNSCFNGKIAFGSQASNAITENASIQYINSGLFYRGTVLTGTGTAAAGNGTNGYTGALWKFNLGIAIPNDGDKITIRVPVASHDYGTYVSLDNGTTYRAVGINGGTTRLTGQYPVNSIVTLVYDATGTITSLFPPVTPATSRASSNTTNIPGAGCWRVLNYYDSGNTNDSAGYIRQMQNAAYRKTTTALYRYKLLLPHKDGIQVIPVNTTDIQNNTSHPFSTAMTTITTEEFDITRPIEYYNTTTTVNAAGNIDGRYHWSMYSGVDLRYSFNTGTTLTAGKDVYLVATLQAGGLTAKLRNPGATGTNAAATATGANAGPITQTLPTSDDGFIYIKLGNAYSTAAIILTPEHPIYWYKGGGVRPFSPNGSSPSGSTSKCLTEKGTWASFTNNAGTVTSITISEGAGITLSATGAITSSGTRTISISGMNTSSGDTTKFLNQKGGWSTVSTSDEKVKVTARGTTKAYLLASTSATSNGTAAVAESNVYLGTTAGHLYATAVHNAVWNDYAEYRAAASYIEPGRVVVDTDNGEVILAAQRLQPGAQVVSDTWGHIMGETEQAKTPIAVAGRVLVYPYRNRNEYHAGMAVCSAPDGTVDIMTRSEIMMYPDCIIGYVSEIPEYETWGSGNVEVKGRIWVRVK